MNLDDIIEYDEEGTNLDFKKEEYKKRSYIALIKDVMSMANALNTENKRIVIGVKHKPGEEKTFEEIDTISDQATLENVIQENIEPNINFKYYAYNFKGVPLAILEIFDNYDKPYMMKKDYGILKKGDMWIRKGSRQSKVTREDLDRMFDIRKKPNFENKVEIGYEKNLAKEITISKASITRESLPSMLRKKDLEVLLQRLDERYSENSECVHKKSETIETSLQESIRKLTEFGLFSEFKDSEKSIRVGYNELNMPVYENREQLLKKINDAAKTYYNEDCYYIYEKNSSKINFYIFNEGTEFLEDVMINLYFDSKIFIVAKERYREPKYFSIYNLNPTLDIPSTNYPYVCEEDGNIIVKEEHKKIRHKTLTKIFFDDLRVLIKPNIDCKKSKIKFIISAKNLSDHIEGSISVNIK